jgi:hypothetical protein
MAVYSLANPERPVQLRRLAQDYSFINSVHDMFVINDTVYASCGYQGLYIFHFNGTKFVQLSSLTNYPDAGYNHSSFISKDHSTLYMCDEVPAGMALKAVDIRDIKDPKVVKTFKSNNGATPHNPYVINDFLVIAYYQDGVQVFDISDPHNPVKSGYFDTYPQNVTGYKSPTYAGNWGAYTDLPSGILLASDMQSGLFVLDVSNLNGVPTIPLTEKNIVVYPNPANNNLNIRLDEIRKPGTVHIYNSEGKLVYQKEFLPTGEHLSLTTEKFASGIYSIRISTDDKSYAGKVSIQH